MKAYQNRDSWLGGMDIFDVEKPNITANQALVKISHAGINHRDYKIRQGQYSWNFKSNVTLGSDGYGTVISVSDEKNKGWLGKEVIINPNQNWGKNHKFPSKNYSVLGMPSDGTFAEYIAINIDRLAEKPTHLIASEAAALSLSGLTAYEIVFSKADIRQNTNVLITGAGGAVSQMAIKFALCLKANVYVTSGSDEKIDKVKEWGVKNGQNYKDEKWAEKLEREVGQFDVVIDSSVGSSISSLFQLLKPCGKYVFYGATSGNPKNFSLSIAYYKQLQLIGSLMGSDFDFEHMLNYVNKYKIKPEIHTILPLNEIETAFKLLKSKQRFGKIVLSI